jgi:hypothetical protein
MHATPGPFAVAVGTYRDLGWVGVLPLPHGQKLPPPPGYSGRDGRDPSDADVQAWRESDEAAGNIALRMPDDVVGVDVDCYDGKPGAATLAKAERDWGVLPVTWRSTSRDDGSGIRLFRVPAGLTWGDVGPAVETISRGAQIRRRVAQHPPGHRPHLRMDRPGRQQRATQP